MVTKLTNVICVAPRWKKRPSSPGGAGACPSQGHPRVGPTNPPDRSRQFHRLSRALGPKGQISKLGQGGHPATEGGRPGDSPNRPIRMIIMRGPACTSQHAMARCGKMKRYGTNGQTRTWFQVRRARFPGTECSLARASSSSRSKAESRSISMATARQTSRCTEKIQGRLRLSRRALRLLEERVARPRVANGHFRRELYQRWLVGGLRPPW